MEIKIAVKENNSDPNLDEENYSEFLMQIYKKFPGAIWEKSNEGFKIFI